MEGLMDGSFKTKRSEVEESAGVDVLAWSSAMKLRISSR